MVKMVVSFLVEEIKEGIMIMAENLEGADMVATKGGLEVAAVVMKVDLGAVVVMAAIEVILSIEIGTTVDKETSEKGLAGMIVNQDVIFEPLPLYEMPFEIQDVLFIP